MLAAGDGQRFGFDVGALCMDLLYTGGRRERDVYETLRGPADLEAWVQGSRLAVAGALPARIDVTDADVGGAGELREVLWRAENDLADGRDLGAAQVAALNRAATGPGLVPTLDERQRRAWPAPVTGSRVVTEVARDAVATFGGPLRDRVPRCAGDRCALVFMDTSRPGARRWCSMQRCGGREKSRAFRDRGRTGLEERGTE